jgi:hypothetical protein
LNTSPADLAAEAVEHLLLRDDVERRRLFLVERAQPEPVLAPLLERDVPLDHLYDVGGLADGVDGLAGDARHPSSLSRRW